MKCFIKLLFEMDFVLFVFYFYKLFVKAYAKLIKKFNEDPPQSTRCPPFVSFRLSVEVCSVRHVVVAFLPISCGFFTIPFLGDNERRSIFEDCDDDGNNLRGQRFLVNVTIIGLADQSNRSSMGVRPTKMRLRGD